MQPAQLLRSTFGVRPDIQARIDKVYMAGLAEYGQPLTVNSIIDRERATVRSALDNAADESIDAMLYLIVAARLNQSHNDHTQRDIQDAIAQMRAALTLMCNAIARDD